MRGSLERKRRSQSTLRRFEIGGASRFSWSPDAGMRSGLGCVGTGRFRRGVGTKWSGRPMYGLFHVKQFPAVWSLCPGPEDVELVGSVVRLESTQAASGGPHGSQLN